jgi:hypothetical protein
MDFWFTSYTPISDILATISNYDYDPTLDCWQMSPSMKHRQRKIGMLPMHSRTWCGKCVLDIQHNHVAKSNKGTSPRNILPAPGTPEVKVKIPTYGRGMMVENRLKAISVSLCEKHSFRYTHTLQPCFTSNLSPLAHLVTSSPLLSSPLLSYLSCPVLSLSRFSSWFFVRWLYPIPLFSDYSWNKNPWRHDLTNQKPELVHPLNQPPGAFVSHFCRSQI